MVLHRTASGNASHTLRLVGFGAAYALTLATGTALLIAAFGSHDDGRVTGPDGLKVTAAEVVMQQAAQRALQPPQGVLVASRNALNDKRGF